MSKKIILDCDPGHDDAVAILLAVGNPNIDLLGVTTVGGNQSLDKVTYNARAVLEKAHATDVSVHAPDVTVRWYASRKWQLPFTAKPVLTALNCLNPAVRWKPAMPSTGLSTPL